MILLAIIFIAQKRHRRIENKNQARIVINLGLDLSFLYIISKRNFINMNDHQPKNKWKIQPALTAVAAILIITAIGLILWNQSHASPLSAARLSSDPSLGSPSAKVTIIEYGDFGCTTCRGWEKAGVLKQIVAAYGDQIHFVWRDYPIITAQSPKAAQAGQCAFDQNMFWQYHDLLYAKAPALSISDLKSYAAQLGMNTTLFNQCLDSGQDKAKVDQSMQEAQQAGFTATPSFLVNGKKVIGPASFDQFKAVIDPLLAGG
jgi:protein-disulfide isomerase